MTVIEATLSKGLTDLTWSSQRILPFLNTVKSNIGDISSAINEFRTKVQELDSKLKRFTSFTIIDFQTNDNENASSPTIQDIERRSKLVLKEYNYLAMQMKKIENYMLGQSTDLIDLIKSMKEYYDTELQETLLKICLRSSINWFYVMNSGKLSPITNMMAEKGFDLIIFDLQRLQHWTPESSKLMSIISNNLAGY